MKTILRLALASSALVAAAAHAQFVSPNTSSGGDLLLFVEDTTKDQTYALDTGITLNSIFNSSNILSTSAWNTASSSSTVIPNATSITTASTPIAADTNLQTFLTQVGSDPLQWGVEAGAYTATTQTAGVAVGGDRFLTTTSATAGKILAVTGTNIYSQWQHLGIDVSNMNAFGGAGDTALPAGQSDTTEGTSTATSGTGIWGDTANGQLSNQNWYSNTGLNTAGNSFTKGTSSTLALYGLTGNGTPGKAQSYVVGTVTLSATGAFSFAPNGGSPVPLPAAIWLFGSGLLGLAGVGRRRSVA